MIKRLVIIGIYTGLAQLFSVFVLKEASSSVDVNDLAQLAQMDSLYQLALTLIAGGLQAAAMRNIALEKNWKPEYEKTQSARLTASFLFLPLCFVGFINPAYNIFLLIPLFALSGDYALYAVGRPVLGAAIAFLRVLIPYALVLTAVLFNKQPISNFLLIGVAISYIVSNIYISYRLKVKYWVSPGWSHFQTYIATLPLGFVNLSFYILGLGMLVVAPLFYPEPTIAVAFLGLKLYVIYKGILRIIHQAFIKEMIHDDVCLKIDQLSIIAATAFLGAFIIFPASSIRLLFGETFSEHQLFFQLLAIGALVYSFLLSGTTRALLDRKDRAYIRISVAAAAIALIALPIASTITKLPEAIAWSLLCGELLFAIGLATIMNRPKLILPRLFFLLQCLLFLALIFLIRWQLGDLLSINIACIVSFVGILLFLHRKKFMSLSTNA
ncbi:MAG: hypothetical protein H7Y31_08105 [Chitinophagaceae bacterium]|nr:hypothetical protein [Chitinophagaceae bacterium]